MIRIHPKNGGDKLLYGAKVLGSYVGTEEYIAAQLNKKLDELSLEADAITSVSSLQVQYLLLRWCFCQKIIYLQRTIPAVLINRYLTPGFTALKKVILNSILGRADGIDSATFALAELHIQDLGLGLFNREDTSMAAYLASYIENYYELAAFLSAKQPAHHYIARSLNEVHKQAAKGGPTIHQYLSQTLRRSQRSRVVDQFISPRKVAWIESLRDPHAGLRLDFAPKTAMHRMSNDEFRVALTLRLHLP